MRGERTGASPGTNMQFALLSALGIFFVADGHLNNSYLDIGGLIPYYSFHMQLFVFISGYFCREEQERFASYGIRKFKRLMLPYFAWNLVYGILAAFLRGYGFSFGDPVSLETLFAEPFRTGYQFILNHPAWFVPALFLVELADRAVTVLARPGMAKLAAREAAGDRTAARVKFLFYLLLGLGGIWISRHVGTDGFWLTLVRLLFLLPFYEAGIGQTEKPGIFRNHPAGRHGAGPAGASGDLRREPLPGFSGISVPVSLRLFGDRVLASGEPDSDPGRKGQFVHPLYGAQYLSDHDASHDGAFRHPHSFCALCQICGDFYRI